MAQVSFLAVGGPEARKVALLAALRGTPMTFAEMVAAAPDHAGPPPPVAAPPCRHRSGRWSCGGAVILNCALGRGQAGIIEPEDCAECPDRSPTPV